MSVILLMTTKAGHRRTIILIGSGVAIRAQQGGMLTIQLEYIEMIEGGWLPGSGGMAGFAGCAFCALVNIIRCMAAHTSHRGTLQLAIDMA